MARISAAVKGMGVTVGDGVAVGVGVGVGDSVEVGEGVGRGVLMGMGSGVGEGVGRDARAGGRVAVGDAVGDGAGLAVGVGESTVTGVGLGDTVASPSAHAASSIAPSEQIRREPKRSRIEPIIVASTLFSQSRCAWWSPRLLRMVPGALAMVGRSDDARRTGHGRASRRIGTLRHL